MIQTIISSSVLILVILTIRLVFKGKINPMLQYGLWSLVALRLVSFGWLDLHPIKSAFSVMHAVNSAEATIRGAANIDQVLAGNAAAGTIENAVLIMDNVKTGVMVSGEGISAAAAVDWQLVILILWAAGAFVLGTWLIHVNRRFGREILDNREYLMSAGTGAAVLPVYVTKGLDSPCLMKYKREAAIYVPSGVAADREKLRFAIAHELCHYKHHDLIWAIVRGGLLTFYWFHPLVWVAAIVSKRDCELACDYSVLREIGKEDRLAYGRTLVDLIRQRDHKSDVLQMATTMYGSARGIKERVAMIAGNKKMKAATLISVLLIAALTVGCTFTSEPDPAENAGKGEKAEIEAFSVKWADAFTQRDAKTIYELCENEELYSTIGSVAENGVYWMGWSSPWPWNNDYVIEIEDDATIHIYYYFRTSEPSVYAAKETITVKKFEDAYKATHETLKHFDTIESKADFDEAYKYGFPDFAEFAAAYQAQADENNSNMTETLENPAAAAIHQLNLVGARVSGIYEDPNAEPPLAVVKFAWDDGEAEVDLIRPMLTDESGMKRQATIWIVVNEGPANSSRKEGGTAAKNPSHIDRISAYMETESRNVFSPYYELLDFKISNYEEKLVNGKVEAVFYYQIIHKNHDRDPDTVKYIKEAKESGNPNYQQMYDEYLQPKEMNFDFKVVIDEKDAITLYSNVSPVGTEWEETKMSDFIMK